MSHIINQEFLEYWYNHYLSLGYNEKESITLAEREFNSRD